MGPGTERGHYRDRDREGRYIEQDQSENHDRVSGRGKNIQSKCGDTTQHGPTETQLKIPKT